MASGELARQGPNREGEQGRVHSPFCVGLVAVFIDLRSSHEPFRMNALRHPRYTPLFYAAQYGYTEMATLLLMQGASPSHRANNG